MILIYVLAARIGYVYAAKVGVNVGPIPIFLTEIALLLLLLACFLRNPTRLVSWFVVGKGAGVIGRAVWLLCILDVIYFAFAFPKYRLYAARDLAIFGYSVFFPLTYFALRERADAVKLTRFFVYSGVALAVVAVLKQMTGIDMGLLPVEERVFLSHTVMYLKGTGTAGMIFASALIALLVYGSLEPRARGMVLFAAFLCFDGLALSVKRAAVAGLVLAIGLVFYALRGRAGARLVRRVAVLVGIVILAALLPAGTGLFSAFRGLVFAVGSGAAGAGVDGTTAFRLLRWGYAVQAWLGHPFVGVGFGVSILPWQFDKLQFTSGVFNAGMPHNTFLFVLARMGLVGLAIVLFCWVGGVLSLTRSFRRRRGPDDLAMAGMLVVMAGVAAFSLFLERPWIAAPFWIALATGTRLVQLPPSGLRSTVVGPLRRRVAAAGAQAQPAADAMGGAAKSRRTVSATGLRR